MKRVLLAGVLVYACLAAYSVAAMHKTMEEMAAQADHVIVATVTEVDMVDRGGRPRESGETSLTDGSVIRLHVATQDATVLKGDAALPESLVLPLWRGWKNSLSRTKRNMEGKDFVFFLRGPELEPLYLGEFYLSADELDAVKQQLAR